MKWYHYLACFFAGAFLCNTVPHFVNGISGNAFPTPFANPPGKGLSPSHINMYWALLNLVVGYLLFRAGKVSNKNWASIIIFFIGLAAMGIMLSYGFADKMTH